MGASGVPIPYPSNFPLHTYDLFFLARATVLCVEGMDNQSLKTLPNQHVNFGVSLDRIGIARAFTFGGSRSRVMHDPEQKPRTSLSKSQYVSGDANPTTINHFHEKLLKLKDLMKSKVPHNHCKSC